METEKKLPERFFAFINRDVENENETKKVSVILRVYSLIMCSYLVCQGILLPASGNWPALLPDILFFAIYLLCFALTYRQRTALAINIALAATLLWILFYLYLLGWDCGVQHYMFVLLVFVCVTSRKSASYKIVFASALCALRIGLYLWNKTVEPVIVLNSGMALLHQTLNTITIFICTTAVLLAFSMDNISTEKKLMDYNDKILRMASVDPLTKLYNRRAIDTYLEHLVESSRKAGTGFTVAMGDIDFFKKVNDTYGHEGGDEVLRTIGAKMLEFMSMKGRPARWGGEEFLLIFENANGDEAFAQLDQFRHQLKKMPIPYNNQEIFITMTFGMEEYDFSSDIERCIKRADEKLYMGKTAGRNRVIF